MIVLSMELLARSAEPKEGRYDSSIDAQPFCRCVGDLLRSHIGDACLLGQLTTQRGGISPISLEVLGKWAGN